MASSHVALRAGLASGALCALLSLSSVLHAEPSDAQKETARSLMAEGRALRGQHDLKGALARFQAADAIMAVPTTGYELARAQADLDLLVEARTTIRRLLTPAPKAGEPAPFQEARTKAEALDAELDARIASLHFVVRGAAPNERVDIFVDGEIIAAAAADLPYRVNPGQHVVSAQAQGKQASAPIDVAEGQSAEVPLDLVALAPDPQPPSSPPAHPGGVPTLAYISGGVGAAGLLLGGVSGMLALDSKHSAESGCRDSLCPPSTWADLDHARSYATVSTVGFIVGAVGVGVALGSLLAASPSSNGAALRAHLSASTAGSSLTVSGGF